MSTANRDSLLKITNLVRPALSTQSFIPALSHIRFASGHATAFNDVMAISVKAGVELEQCVPGELFARALDSFNAEQVGLAEGDNDILLVTSGRSKLKLPVLPVNKFPLEMPRAKPDVVGVTETMLQAIRKCLFGVGTDPTHPAQMGVTLQTEDGVLVVYATDNFTITRAVSGAKMRLPGDAPIIVPTAFCEQLLTLAKAFPDDDIDLEMYPGALRAVFGKKAWLLTKTAMDVEPLDFVKIISKYLSLGKVRNDLDVIPTAFDTAWNRALLVLSTEADKATKVTLKSGTIDLFSKGDMGEASDTLEFEAADKLEFHVDPSLVVRAAKVCGSIAFYDRVMVLGTDDATFLHLIAHCAA